MNDSATILAVDDTPESLALLVRILSPAGYRVRPADSGELALAAVAASPPDLVLLDIHMQGVDGFEVCRRLKSREQTRHIPIILISATAGAKAAVEGLQLGAADYVTKPFQAEELLARIKTHLALSRSNITLEQQAAALHQANELLRAEIVERQHAEEELRHSLDRTERSRRAMLSALEDQKRAEEVGARLEAQLVQAQKMEAVGRLAGGVAHDFNNILQAMLSLATVLRIRAGSPELTMTVHEIEGLIRRGAGLTQQLLLFSRRQVAVRACLDLGELASAVGLLLRRLIPENIRLSVEMSPEPVWVEGDPGQLQQVLMNLAVNARDAMPHGGTLVLRTAGAGDDAVLDVIDSGHGMDEATRAHLFEPFFTTKEAGKGTGLGLAVVHGVISEHHGRVEVESALGAGSRFRVVLPRVPAPREEAGDEPSEAEAAPHGQGEHVLIVEDEDGAREGLAELLDLLGYRVTALPSGEAASALPDEAAPNLLLSDLMLPGIPGPELADQLRQRWPGIKVVLMSGYTEDEALRREVDEGRVCFLQKPFDITSLARLLREALGEAG